MPNYGFIMTRHVNSETTNRYWNQCVKLIRATYPLKQIVIIDDNSNYRYVKPDFLYKNVLIIQSEYPKRGELLPYIYYLRYKWWPSAVIIHDSLFIHRRVNFENFNVPVLPLWHHVYDRENVNNITRIASALNNNTKLINKIVGPSVNVLGMNRLNNFNLCFGGQTFINLKFLEMLQQKYNIKNLINVIHNRTDRCSLERVLGLLFCEEYPRLKRLRSLFGDIMLQRRAFNYNYDEYIHDFKHHKAIHRFVKVWTGR
jgi:hypothetical protein